MSRARFALALEQMGSGDWLAFEELAADFLVVEYPSLKTTAAPHGDRGRDGQMYVVDDEPFVVTQYSVTTDWREKINDTVRRLSVTFPRIRRLIYATNQRIGADADDVVQRLRMDRQLALDIRDREWFVERESTHPQRAAAAERVAKRFVDPLLAERGVLDQVAPALGQDEGRVALLHLALEREDQASEKGLTKSAFEALVLSALHDSTAENRMTRDAIVARVRRLLPMEGHERQVEEQSDGALRRLSRRGGPVKQFRKEPEYHLSFQEKEELQERVSSFLLEEQALAEELIAAVRLAAPQLAISDDTYQELAGDLRRGLETVLLRRGEAFAAAVLSGDIVQVNARDVLSVVTEAGRSAAGLLKDEEAATAILSVLDRPSQALRSHLRRLADAYTMYAFLRQTPDVQRAVVKLFTGGELWLDASIIIPLFAETLLSDPADRHYTTILRAANEADMKLYVTEGVLEEIEGNLNICLSFARTQVSEWRTRIPFIYTAYALSGRARHEFASWLENFRGNSRPLDDICDYLNEHYSVQIRSLESEAKLASDELRGAVQEIWIAAHEQRRTRPDIELDIQTARRLAGHDVENTLGVIELRRRSSVHPMGYRHWFLTLDKTALRLKKELREWLTSAPDSPAMSPDFMAEYLRISPVRTAIERELWANLPLLTDISRYEYTPKSLIDLADRLRSENKDAADHVVRRRIRDGLDRERVRLGPEALRGIKGAEERLLKKLEGGGSQ